jgi:hypothetical protein
VELWEFPLDVLVKFKSLMLSQSDYFWRRFLVDHPVAARYRVANTEQPFFISPKSILTTNPRTIWEDGQFSGFVELFPNTEIFISEADNKAVSNALFRVNSYLSGQSLNSGAQIQATSSD